MRKQNTKWAMRNGGLIKRTRLDRPLEAGNQQLGSALCS